MSAPHAVQVRPSRLLGFLHQAVLATSLLLCACCAFLWLESCLETLGSVRSHPPFRYIWDPPSGRSWTKYDCRPFGVLDWMGMGVTVPLWGPSLLAVVYPAKVFGPRYLRRRRRDRWAGSGRCRRCGYDLTGNTSGRCPECGTEVAAGSLDEVSEGPAVGGERIPWQCLRRWAVGLVVLACILLLLFNIVPWARIDSVQQEVDINTGRLRTTRHFLGTVRVRVEDSPLTQALTGEDLRGVQPDWQLVTIFCPSFDRQSPHHRYFGAATQIFALQDLWASASFAPAAKREIARQLLKLWQTSGDYHSARGYMFNLYDCACVPRGAGTIQLTDLPATRPSWMIEGRPFAYP
jgi:hypothetical protein